jgi:hypothetical protein
VGLFLLNLCSLSRHEELWGTSAPFGGVKNRGKFE